MRLRRAILATPIGEMLTLSSDQGLCALEFVEVRNASRPRERLTRLDRRLAKWFPRHEIVDGESEVIVHTRRWLQDYFAGTAAAVDLRLDMRGAAFEKQVWSALLEIPAGETTSYGAIAKRLGSPSASRAVGLANGANPIAIVVPCHRVIGSTGALTGYGGGLDRKTWLLDHERRWRRDSLF
jgi:methylated-DNA-[protein]-cysteine S-methyltransferase